MKSKWKILKISAKWDRIKIPIYEASAQGKHIPIIKTLLTNSCICECKYCALRRGCAIERTMWDVEELVKVTISLWKKGIVKGIFLSSGVFKDPEYTSEKQVEVAEKLREMGFTGYIHLRLMPGVSKDTIWRAAIVADRVGINLETTSESAFNDIAPDKGSYINDIVKRLEWLAKAQQILSSYKGKLAQKYGYLRSGIDTQVMVGIVDETDLEHLVLAEKLYKEFGMRRVYFSPFEPIPGTPYENKRPCPLNRVKRLYQASYLLRDYGFTVKELKTILNDKGMLPDKDPKMAYAEANKHIYPIDLNAAEYHEILKIPGIGPKTAKKIIAIRNSKGKIGSSDLVKIVGRSRIRELKKYATLS